MADTPPRKTLSIKPGTSRETDRDRSRTGARAHRVARSTVRTRDDEAADTRGRSEAPGERRGPRPERDAQRRPAPGGRGDADARARGPRRDDARGEWRPRTEREARDTERRPYPPREGGERYPRSRPYAEEQRGERRPYTPRGRNEDAPRGRWNAEERTGERRPYPPRERSEGFARSRPDTEGRAGERRPYAAREGEERFGRGRPETAERGERRPHPPREGGERFSRSREAGEGRAEGRRPYPPREGSERFTRPRPASEDQRGERRPYAPREGDERFPRTRPAPEGQRGERRPYPPREGGERYPRSRPYAEDQRGERRPYTPREGDDRAPRGRWNAEERTGERRPYQPRAEREFEARRPFPRREDEGRPAHAPRGEGRDERYAPRGEAAERRGPRMQTAETYPIFAPCPQGLEQALADELTALGFEDVATARAGCRFTANWTGMMRANLHSRLATRILLQVAQGPVATEDDILALAHATPWERWFGAEQTLRVDTSAVRSPMRSLQYCNLRAKDGICDRLREREGERPSIDTVRPDARVHLFLDESSATLYLDTSGESLFKRGWRYDKGEAPLRENLAAGLLALSGWRGETALLDPFCGSGTILIEAAYIALRVPPGVNRPFAFERLRGHDEYLWRSLKDEARAAILPRLEIPLVGSDIDARAIEAARHNAERAQLTPEAIRFEVADARDTRPPSDEPGAIITNPPYGERLETEEAELWAGWAQTLKAHFDGWRAHVITTDRDLPKHLRLNAQRRVPLYNGALDCRLFDFEIVGGSYRQKI